MLCPIIIVVNLMIMKLFKLILQLKTIFKQKLSKLYLKVNKSLTPLIPQLETNRFNSSILIITKQRIILISQP